MSVITELKKRFCYPVGFSDHTVGIECATASVSLGATIIEKHVTLDKSQQGPDHKASATIEEFSQLVIAIRNIEAAMGEPIKKFSNEEIEIRNSARKSIVTQRDIQQHTTITQEDICFKRPGTGYSPIEKNIVIGRKAKRLLKENTLIIKDDLY